MSFAHPWRHEKTTLSLFRGSGFFMGMRGQKMTLGETGPGWSPKRSQAEPFVAEENYQDQQRTGLSMLLV